MAGQTGQRIIGGKARYAGKDFPGMDRVVIVAAMIDDGSGDPDNHIHLDRDDEIALAGGVKPTDRVEVRPIHPDGRVSFVTCDPIYGDLSLID